MSNRAAFTAASEFLYFFDAPSGPVELCGNSTPMRNSEFASKFPGVKGIRYDGFAKQVAQKKGGAWGECLPVTRIIRYKSNPSLHVCNSKCMGGKINGTCECSCGGKNHGCNSL